jgi:ABC-type glycerol-3-phosphate transport system substrate-binding protein
MKRIFALFLSAALLLGLAACGAQETVASAVTAEPAKSVPTAEPALAEEINGYLLPTSWTENSMNDGTWGYLTAEFEVPADGSYGVDGAGLMAQAEDAGVTTLIRRDFDGAEQCRVDIPLPETTGDNQSAWLGAYAFGGDSVWVSQGRMTITDETTFETESEEWLEQWDYDGTQLTVFSVEDLGISPDDNTIADLALDADGNLLLLDANQTLYFCDSQGSVLATETLGGSSRFCKDADGRLYIQNLAENQVYTIDWANHALGQSLLTTEGDETVLMGSGGYDLFLSSDTKLRGVVLETGTITEILSWADCDLVSSVGGVACLDQDTLLVSVLGGSGEVLTLSRVPADQIPEKSVVRLAVGLSENGASWGQTWSDVLDTTVVAAITRFNRASSAYRVEVETYASMEELNLKLLSGDAPDIIDWNTAAGLEDTPSMALYAQRGYLADLEPFIDQDPELSQSDFIPNILALAKQRTGGLYALPLDFHFTTLTGPTEYVEEYSTWTISDLLDLAANLPEDTILLETTQSEMLDTLLRTDIGDFVDISTGTCDFQNQEFYDLLTLCRDYFPAEYSETGGKTALFQSVSALGRMGNFAADVLQNLEAQGQTLVGYPGAGGSGVSIVFGDEYAICALGQEQAGAWEFLRTLYLYDFQRNNTGIFSPVRQDALDDREDQFLEVNGSCTQAESQAARQLIYDVANVRINDSPVVPMVEEEAAAFFSGDKTAQEVAQILQNRVEIYLGEQS